VPIKRSNIGRTSLLAAVALCALMIQLFPSYVTVIKWVVIALGVLYVAVRAWTMIPAWFLERRRQEQQVSADASEYREYERDLAAIRSRFVVNDAATTVETPPAAYQAALTALNEKHKEMLIRKFGAY
jgi:hypothetical protein